MIGNRFIRLAGAAVLGLTVALSFGAVAAQEATPTAQTQTPYLGVSIAAAETGAMVTAVAPNGPAEQAGVQANDVITTFDGQKVTVETLADAVAMRSVGDSVKLTVLRGEQTVDLTVTLAARPTTTAPANVPGNQGNAAQSATTPYIGLGLSDDNNAVTVAEVAAGSPAETAGFKVGDVVTKIGDTDVKTAQDVITVVRAAKPGDKLTLHVTRSGEDVAIDVTVGQTTMQQLNRGGNRGNFQGQSANGDAFSFNGTSWDIQNLDQDSALYKAGLRSGDQITAINGSDKLDPQSLMQALMGQNDANATVKLTITRDGQSQTLDVPASALQEMMMGGFGGFPFGNDQGNGNGFPFNFGQMGQAASGVHLGVEIVNLDATTAKQHNLTVTDGALVMSVEPNSPADKAGIKVNDVITAIDGDKVTQRRTLVDRLYGWKDGDEITVTVLRDGQSMDLKATLVADQQQSGTTMNESPLQFFFGNGGQNGNGFTFPNIPAPQQTQPDQALPTT